MNIIEKLVHEKLSKIPALKRVIRNIYQLVLSNFPSSDHFAYDIEIAKNHFFGFHDISPWSFDNKYILTHKLVQQKQSLSTPVEIGLLCGQTLNNYRRVGMSRCWNFQQGSRLQWIGRSHQFLFNDHANNSVVSKVKNIEGEDLHTYKFPIYIVSNDGKSALSFSFDRLGRGLAGYGYEFSQGKSAQEKIPSNEGLYLIDMKSEESTMLLSLRQAVSFQPEKDFFDSYHFFSHCLFSPSDKRIVFFHQWVTPTGLVKNRMFSLDTNGENIFLFPTDGMVSHISWTSEDHIIAYASTIHGGSGYYLFTDQNDTFEKITTKKLSSDGHPHASKDGRWIITDTYPDRCRDQFLKLYDLKHNICEDLLKLRIPFFFRDEKRCDFHPRWDRETKLICFDAVMDGTRSQCIMKVPLKP
ncbi:hypothetical protein OPS25_12020 [Alteromonas ponticola]|uniref:Glycosyl transferase n=1 Tax=Alteromonas aquimaris TaxID=2998417 RepID=A0ABT3P8Y1_9ALTE|nr:hypothetical protein [Alteromonas aquimaris]MCW8109225.1 hypothetical protein [Alteromonas aquimaris]